MDTLNQWLADWQQYKYYREISFVVFTPFIFLLRSLLVRRLKKYTDRLGNHDVYPFIISLINWGTFYVFIGYGIIYFKDTFVLGHTWFKVGNTPITALTLIIPATLISLSFKLSRFLSGFVLNKFYDHYQVAEEAQYTFNRLIHYIVVILAFLIALPIVGFNLSALTVFAGVLGVGVGFGISNIASNFISGLIILFERPIKIGDTITVDNMDGVVEHINMRATILRTFDNERVIIPNSQFIENRVMNWSYADPKLRLDIIIGIAHGSDVKLAEQLLLQAAQEGEHVLTDPAPAVYFTEIGQSMLTLRMIFWVPDSSHILSSKSDVNHRVNELFAEHNIEIPFPQQDLHLRSVDRAVLQKFPSQSER